MQEDEQSTSAEEEAESEERNRRASEREWGRALEQDEVAPAPRRGRARRFALGDAHADLRAAGAKRVEQPAHHGIHGRATGPLLDGQLDDGAAQRAHHATLPRSWAGRPDSCRSP